MRCLAALLLAGTAAPILSGCVAAALPLVAAGAIAREEVSGNRTRGRQPTVEVLPDAAPAPIASAGPADPQASADPPPPISEAPPPPGQSAPAITHATDAPVAPAPPASATPPASPAPSDVVAAAEPVRASSIEVALAEIRNRLPVYAPRGDQPYDDFIRFALQQAERREAGQLSETIMLSAPPLNGVMQLLPCGFLPPAVIVDLDDGTGTGLNLATADSASGVSAAAGLAEGLEQLRQRDVAIIWMTSQPFDRFDAISGLLRATGLDRVGSDTVVLTRTVSERKQERRKDTAASHCILAIAGDRKADFDELYDYLRNPDVPIESDRMIGAGWFLAPQPLIAGASAAPAQP